MLELNYGRRYGLLGLNGCGKSTLLTAIGLRELPIPDHMDIYHLSHEIEATDMTSLEAVMSCDEERLKLEKEIETLVEQVLCKNSLLDFGMCCVWMLILVFFFGNRMMEAESVLTQSTSG